MRIEFKLAALRRTKPHEYAIRFVSGGATTVLAGLIANRFGPVVGGLFLAFPSIYPASLTLLAKHAKEKREREGLPGERRAELEAALDSRGAALGCFGLMSFAIVIWKLIPSRGEALSLIAALAAWAAISSFCWLADRRL